jgi:hypothetical protein
MAASVAALKKRLERLKTLRQVHEQVWLDCFDHSFPIRGSGLQGGQPLDAQQALDRKARLLHSAATDAGRTLAAGIVSGATPSSSVWALLSVVGADDAGKQWLDEKAKQLHEEVHAGNFDASSMECALDLVAAGWFALYVDDNAGAGGLLFTQWPIAQVFAASSRPGGIVDTVFRVYQQSAEQCVTEFGFENCSAQVQKQWTEEPDTQVTICKAIYPRTDYKAGAAMARNLPVASCTFEVDTGQLVRESGYHEMPVIVPRWAVIPNSVYAIGPMFDALPDARELNEFLRMDRMNAELAIAGMWIATDDGVLNPRTVKVGPRKVIVANDVDSMKQLSAGGDWQLADSRIAQYHAAIRRILMADQLQAQDGPAMTATEVHVRVNMIRQLLGPVYGRLQAEYLAPLVERCFGLMYRAGLFGMAPASLGGSNFKVKYNNPLARAQKQEDVGAVERLTNDLTALAALGQTVPAAAAALDRIDFDATVEIIVDGLGVPLKVMRDDEATASFRQARADQQAQAQQAAQQQQIQTMAAQGAVDRAVKQPA